MTQPKVWKIGGGRQLTLDRTYIMGILNVTPDSFSDGGLFPKLQAPFPAPMKWRNRART